MPIRRRAPAINTMAVGFTSISQVMRVSALHHCGNDRRFGVGARPNNHLQGICKFQATLEKHQHGPECGPKSSNEGDPAQGQDGVEHLTGEPSASIVVSVQFFHIRQETLAT